MRRLTLHEYRREPEVELTTRQRDVLAEVARVDVRPSVGLTGAYDLTPGSTVGTLTIDGLQVDLRPKVELDRLLFLVSYALDPVRWQNHLVAVDMRATLVEAMAYLWLSAAIQALGRGPLQGYQRREEALATVRGRIRVEDQVRTRFGLLPPVEVAFDEFTTDIEENRLLKAAAHRISRLHLEDARLRDRLARVLALLDDVPSVGYAGRHLPVIEYTRLNEHYRPAVELSKLVLTSTSIELGEARLPAAAFLVNMNEVFETFLHVALARAMPDSRIIHERPLHLDEDKRVLMKPDLTWMDGSQVSFVGDAKYKALRDRRGINADLYQLLAYVIALELPAGMLVYAKGEGEPGRHEVVDLGRSLHVEWLDVAGEPSAILASVARLAERIDQLSRQTAQLQE